MMLMTMLVYLELIKTGLRCWAYDVEGAHAIR